MGKLKDTTGFIQLPLGLLLIAAGIFSFYALAVMKSWSDQSKIQLQLDECVGRAAHSGKRNLTRLDSSNQRIHAIRALIAATSALPQARAALEAALQLEVWIQEVTLHSWKMKQVLWLTQFGCNSLGRFPVNPLPSMPWTRPPPDFLGAQALKWTGKNPRALEIRLASKSRASAARVYEDSENDPTGEWKTKWISAKRAGIHWPNFH